MTAVRLPGLSRPAIFLPHLPLVRVLRRSREAAECLEEYRLLQRTALPGVRGRTTADGARMDGGPGARRTTMPKTTGCSK
ncbi:MAG: hypothetical protein MZU91_00715 [Desulfosudis oleivorans]|nr:hypothetical protein [Desulfosudis oleivorans]